MKRIIFLLMSLTMIALLVGCNSKTQSVEQDTTSSSIETTSNISQEETTKITVEAEDTTQTQKIYDIKDIVVESNNLFDYDGISVDDYDEEYGSRIIWTYSTKNISDQPQVANIRIKFYDENKNLIVDYQHKYSNPEYVPSNPFYLKPQEARNLSFTIYDDKLPEGKTLADAKYYSIEDIVYY